MDGVKASRRKKIVTILLVIIVACIGAVNILWLAYKHYCYDMIVTKNAEFESISSETNNKAFKLTRTNEDKLLNVDVVIFYPHYLKADGNYCFSQQLYLKELRTDNEEYENSYHVSIAVKPSIWHKTIYQVQLTDFTDNRTLYSFEMDNNMGLISYNGKSPETVLRVPEAMTSVESTINIAKEFIG